MRSLRANLVLGAVFWTLGLMALWAVFLTFHRKMPPSIAVIHRYPHTLMAAAIVATAAGFAIVTRGLVPLQDLRRKLLAVRAGSAHAVDGRFPAEIDPLVRDLNALLAHQSESVSRAHAKAGDLAHGLKTPLAILVHEADRAEALGHAELAAGIREQVERMRRQIEYHLAHARAAASAANPNAKTPIAESVRPLVRTVERLYASRGLTIDVSVPPEHAVRCERQDLDEMIGNLLDNACKWARARVTVTSMPVLPPEGGMAIVIDDDGPGIEPRMRLDVLRRGVRADEASPGSGLGLAIVRELAEVYGGSVLLNDAPGGGLSATLRLPSGNAPRQG